MQEPELDYERVRVARVTVDNGDRVDEIRGCWIAVSVADSRVGIWLEPDQRDPTLSAPLEDITIDWAERN